LVVAFRAFVFCEIRDRRVVPSGLMDRRIAPTTPGRIAHARPQADDAAIVIVGGSHDLMRRFAGQRCVLAALAPSARALNSIPPRPRGSARVAALRVACRPWAQPARGPDRDRAR